MKTQRNLRALCFAIALLVSASLVPVFAQSSNSNRYEITENGKRIATVVASFDGEVVSTAIFRQGRPTHLYRAYPQVGAIKVQVDDQPAFTYYIGTGLIEAKNFSFNIREVKWSARQKRSDVAALRQQLAGDMTILRAVRGYDPSAHVRLAELAYVNLTGDDSIYEGDPPSTLIVIGSGQAKSKSKTSGSKFMRTALVPQSTTGNPDSLGGCLDTCTQQKDACIRDGVDKGKCYDNQTSCTNNCYNVYGNKKAPMTAPNPN